MVGELYSYVFHFLRCAMKWYQSKSWKKVLDGINENFFSSFESTITSIKLLKERIYHKTALKTQAEIKDVHSLLRDFIRMEQEAMVHPKTAPVSQAEIIDIHSLLKQFARREQEAKVAEKRQWYSLEERDECFLQLAREIGLGVKKLLESNFEDSTHPGRTTR